MCIIAAKPIGTKMPSEETLLNMWLNNSDGAGFMYAMNSMVHIEKGFMKYEDFEKAIEKLGKKYDLTKLPLVMHFRITTHGGTCKENCHPFPITDSIGKLKKTKTETKIGVAHNGIIDITPRKGISDTMEYVASQLAPLSKGVPKFYQNKHLMQMVENATDSKLVIMDEKGSIYYEGDFINDSGIMYSNASYKKTKSWRDFTYGNFTMDDWEIQSGMEDYYYMPVMWIDETEGQYVRLKNGNMVTGDYAISKYGGVYEYDYNTDALRRKFEAEAFTADGMPLEYDPKSPLLVEELIVNAW